MATVLVAIGDVDLSESVARALRAGGHRVVGSSVSDDVTRQAAAADLVILEYDPASSAIYKQLIELSGNARTSATPVIVAGPVTGHCDLAALCAHGASDYLPIPLISEEAVSKTERALQPTTRLAGGWNMRARVAAMGVG